MLRQAAIMGVGVFLFAKHEKPTINIIFVRIWNTISELSTLFVFGVVIQISESETLLLTFTDLSL